jgi:hypothetical protein
MSDRNGSESADNTEQPVGLGDFLKYYQPGSGEKQKEWHERILPGIQDALIANPTEPAILIMEFQLLLRGRSSSRP